MLSAIGKLGSPCFRPCRRSIPIVRPPHCQDTKDGRRQTCDSFLGSYPDLRRPRVSCMHCHRVSRERQPVGIVKKELTCKSPRKNGMVESWRAGAIRSRTRSCSSKFALYSGQAFFLSDGGPAESRTACIQTWVWNQVSCDTSLLLATSRIMAPIVSSAAKA